MYTVRYGISHVVKAQKLEQTFFIAIIIVLYTRIQWHNYIAPATVQGYMVYELAFDGFGRFNGLIFFDL